MKKLLLNSKSFVIAFVMANLFLFNAATAQTNTWSGATSTAWATTTNWSLGHAPLAAEDVVIPNSTTIVNWPNLAATTTIKSLSMNGRTAAGGDRGGSVTINTAGVTLTITGNLTINGSTGGTTENTLTGITLTGTNSSLSVGGNIATTNGTTAEQPEITLGTGTLTVGGNITIGTIVGFTVSAAGTLVLNGAAAQTVTSATAAARTYNNLTLSGAGSKTLASGTILNGKLTWLGAGALITNAPTYGATSTLEYAGATAQTSTNIEFPAAGSPANLIINNANGVTLNASKTIATALTMTSGQLIIPTGITFTITATGAIGGSPFTAANSIVTQVNTGTGAKGIVRVNVPAATARLVPVSDGTNYLPVTINAPNASGYNVTVFNGLTTNSAPNGTAFSAAAKSECVDAVWNVNLANGVGTGVNIALGWPASLEGSKFAAITSNALIGLSHSQAGIWDSPTFGSGSYPTNSAARTVAVVASSSFAVGTVYPAGGILPIKVNYFNAAKGNGYNTLNWSAVSTSDQMIFDIERSADGKNFTAINSITATRLDCLQPFNYVDNSNLSGTVYYRIKITDFNGKVTYSSVVRIATPQTDMKLVGVLPNPVSNTAQLNVVSDKKDNVQLYVVSMTGQLVQRSTVQLQPGSSIINLDVTNLQNGMYTIKGTFSNGTVSAVKFIKQ